MFEQVLRQCVECTAGSYAGLVMDVEGVPVASYKRDGSVGDIEVIGAEASVVVKALLRTAEMLESGPAREMSFQTAELIALIRILTPSYFVAMTLGPEGNLGRARFALRLNAPKLLEGLR